jgi:hypothetical protein
LARKTVLVCDNCEREVGEGKGATLRMTFADARRGAKAADLCDDCAGKMPGRAAARRDAARRRPSHSREERVEAPALVFVPCREPAGATSRMP